MSNAMILTWTVEATVVLALGLVLAHRRGWSAAAGHRVLVLALGCALLLPIASLAASNAGWGLFNATSIVSAGPVSTVAPLQQTIGEVDAMTRSHEAAVDRTSESRLIASTADEEPAPALATLVAHAAWIAWAALSLAMAVRLLLAIVSGVALRMRSTPSPDARLRATVDRVGHDLGLTRPIELRVSATAACPLVWCWGRPCIIVPACEVAGRVDWNAVIAHEIAHMKRRDHLAIMLAEIVLCLLPWHPLAWCVSRRLNSLAERACDDWALRCAGSPADYAESLLAFCRQGRGQVLTLAIVSHSEVGARVMRVLSGDPRETRIGRRIALGGPIVAALVLSMTALAQPRGAAPSLVHDTPASGSDVNSPVVRVRVRTPAGPQRAFDVALVDVEQRLPRTRRWTRSDSEGVATIVAGAMSEPADGGRGEHMLVARGDFGWAVAPVTLDGDGIADVDIRASLPRQLELHLLAPAGHSIPVDLNPVVYIEETAFAAWLRHVQHHDALIDDPGAEFSMTSARRVPEASGDRAATFQLTVPSDATRFWVLIDRPGFLRATSLGPLELPAAGASSLELQLPQPASLRIEAAPEPGWPATYGATAIGITMPLPETSHSGRMWSIPIATVVTAGTSSTVELHDLPSASVFVGASTLPALQKVSVGPTAQVRGGMHSISRQFTLVPGQNEPVLLPLRGFDEQHIRRVIAEDKRTLHLTVTDADGTPAAGQFVAAYIDLKALGFGQALKIADQVVPETGVVDIVGVPASDTGRVVVEVAGTSDVLSLDPAGPRVVHHTLSLAPKVGGRAPDITLVLLDAGVAMRLSELRGRVVLLEFWATWCGPCQPAMASNDELAGRRADWGDRVTIVGASTDDALETIRAHVSKRGWNNVSQMWDGPHVNGRSSGARAYGVRGIPAAFLIDGNGTLRWAGHPGDIDVEREIDLLLAERQ